MKKLPERPIWHREVKFGSFMLRKLSWYGLLKACFRMTLFIFIKREDQSCDRSHDSFHHVIQNPPFGNFDLWKISIFWNFYHNFMVLKMKKNSLEIRILILSIFHHFDVKWGGRKNASGKYEIWLWLRISPNAHRSMFNSHIRFQTGFLSDFSELSVMFAENVSSGRTPAAIKLNSEIEFSGIK